MAGNSSSPLIDVHQLRRLLGDAAYVFTLEAIDACPSTNTLLLDQAEAGAPSGKVVITDRQTAGRGSRGRQWQASPEASLTFSLLWRFDCEMAQLSGLSLGVGFVCGGLWALIAAVLKARFNISEIIVTIMLNYIAIKWVTYLQYGPWKDPKASGFPKMPKFADAAVLTPSFLRIVRTASGDAAP